MIKGERKKKKEKERKKKKKKKERKRKKKKEKERKRGKGKPEILSKKIVHYLSFTITNTLTKTKKERRREFQCFVCLPMYRLFVVVGIVVVVDVEICFFVVVIVLSIVVVIFFFYIPSLLPKILSGGMISPRILFPPNSHLLSIPPHPPQKQAITKPLTNPPPLSKTQKKTF